MSGAEPITYGKWVLFFGVPLGWAFWELWRVERSLRADRERARSVGEDAPDDLTR